MKTNKDVPAFLESENGFPMEKYGSTFMECSKNNAGKPLVTSTGSCYNFDRIVEDIFQQKELETTSADSLRIRGKWIEFIEFKGGYTTKAKEEYEPLDTDCPNCRKYHQEAFERFIDYRKEHQKQLRENLRLKAVESLYILQNYIRPPRELSLY